VFSGLGFESLAGEALAVTGPNGSGKTSLLRLIAGLLHPAGGSIELSGGDAELTLPEQAHYLGHRDALKPALSKSRPENTSRPPRTHVTPRPESRIWSFTALSLTNVCLMFSWGSAAYFVGAQCCGSIVSVAALLERFYKPEP